MPARCTATFGGRLVFGSGVSGLRLTRLRFSVLRLGLGSGFVVWAPAYSGAEFGKPAPCRRLGCGQAVSGGMCHAWRRSRWPLATCNEGPPGTCSQGMLS